MPAEGFIELLPAGKDRGHKILAPTGDFTNTVGPYDPSTGVLYYAGARSSGWVEVDPIAGTWLFGERGQFKPQLRDDPRDNYSVVPLQRSETVGLQFYIGFTKPHWLTGRSDYRVYAVLGAASWRLPTLEREEMRYLGDDLVAGMAVFIPRGIKWKDREDHLVWFDGASIVEPEQAQQIPDRFCDRP